MLKHDPWALPSFACLTAEQQHAIRFTQVDATPPSSELLACTSYWMLRLCFHSLPAAANRSSQAMAGCPQADICFNHGWLVQAEAPPGILFRTFKVRSSTPDAQEVHFCEHLISFACRRLMQRYIEEDGISAHDIAFYFVHWLTVHTIQPVLAIIGVVGGRHACA